MREDKLSLVAKVSKKDPSSLRLTITPQSEGQMAVGTNRNGNVTLDLSEIVAATSPTWDYRSDGAIEVEYVELKAPPEEFRRKARILPGWPEGKALFAAPDQGRPSRIDVLLQGFSFRQDVEVALPITIRLNNVNCSVHSAANPSADLRVSFQSQPPDIQSFGATPSIVPVGSSTTLSWSCANATKGCTLYIDDTPEAVDACGDKPIQINQASIMSLRLKAEANGGGVAITEPLRVKALETKGWLSGTGWWQARVARLVVASDGKSLYAVVVPNAASDKPELWRSPDGFSVWKKIDADIPPDLATSPAVCFGFGSKGPGHLVFVGGSRIDRRPQQVSNRVYRLDPATGKKVGEHVAEWKARIGHACVVATNELGHESIWIMGGVDEYLNPLNDVWVWDGNDGTGGKTRWTERSTDGALWSPRCTLSATVRGTELWVGGGFETPAGKPLLDIQISETTGPRLSWRRPITREGNDYPEQTIVSKERKSFNASTMTALRDSVYLLGNYGDRGNTEFRSVTGKSLGPMTLTVRTAEPEWPEFKAPGGVPSHLESVSFNGCLWLVAQAYQEGGKWESSSLYYWAPPPSAA